MLFRGLQHEPDLLSKRSLSEQKDHDQRMREADFGSVDGAIAGGFDDGEERGEVGVQNDRFD